MLWNWSLWDYFKKEQLEYRYEFLFEELRIDPNRIYQSVFGWNDLVEEDLESIRIVQDIFARYGVVAELGPKTHGKWEEGPGVVCDFTRQRIFQYSDKNWRQRGNVVGEVWWPDTETFYDTGKDHDETFGKYCHPNCDCGRFIEIGNSVFIQYKLSEDGWNKIQNSNVDFGGGLERITMAAQKKENVFLTDIFSDYIDIFEKTYWVTYAEHSKNLEIIVDHCRAIVFLVMDGCMVSNKDQGYFLRRLIRRVSTKIHLLGVDPKSFMETIDAIIDKLKAVYPEMFEKREYIHAVVAKEQQLFSKNLIHGMSYFSKITSSKTAVSGDDAFLLQTTHGFPIDLIRELCEEQNIPLDIDWYYAKVEEHKNISRQWADKKFKSGLWDNSEQTVRYHTLTHLLHKTLIDLLGDQVQQKWSNLTQERLRFDFSYSKPITPDEIQQVEDLVNRKIHDWFTVSSQVLKTTDALQSGAIWLFGERYPDEVSVYTIQNNHGEVISKEICTGPHIKDSLGLGIFKITDCVSIGSDIKRIKAVLVENA